jgi:hypothetical protein
MDHAPIVMKNQVFLPIPEGFEREMVPTDKMLKFIVRHKILGTGDTNYGWN